MADEKPAEQPPESQAPRKQERDLWDKAQILVPALTPLALFFLGLWGNQALQRDQQQRALAMQRDQEQRAFVELLSRREEADSNLRKDMFAEVIKQFSAIRSPGTWTRGSSIWSSWPTTSTSRSTLAPC